MSHNSTVLWEDQIWKNPKERSQDSPVKLRSALQVRICVDDPLAKERTVSCTSVPRLLRRYWMAYPNTAAEIIGRKSFDIKTYDYAILHPARSARHPAHAARIGIQRAARLWHLARAARLRHPARVARHRHPERAARHPARATRHQCARHDGRKSMTVTWQNISSSRTLSWATC